MVTRIASGIAMLAIGYGAALAQRLPVTETEALSYVLSAFVSQADPGVMRPQVTLGPELEKRLGVASDVEGGRVYRAVIGLIEGKSLEVRKATPAELAAYGARRGFDPGARHALYTLDVGGQKFLIQYDLATARIPFVGELGVADPDPRPVPAPPAPVVAKAAGKPEPLKLSWTGLFEYNSAELTPEARARLDEIVPKVAQLGNLRYLQLSGHGDRLGSPQANQRLSEKRAEAVRDYLVARGLNADSIDIFGYGKTLPIKSCPEDKKSRELIECLAPNRRVVMELEQAK